MRIFVINLHRSADRRRALLSWIGQMGLPWEIFEAVDGAALREDAVPWTNAHWGEKLWPGAVGCYLSHARVLQRVADYGLEWALVIEDDVKLVPERAGALAVMKFPEQFDLIYAHEMTNPWLRSTVAETDGEFHRVNPAMLTTGAYLVSGAYARRFCERFRRVEMPIDHFYRQESRQPEARFYELQTPLFRIEGNFTSTINC